MYRTVRKVVRYGTSMKIGTGTNFIKVHYKAAKTLMLKRENNIIFSAEQELNKN